MNNSMSLEHNVIKEDDIGVNDIVLGRGGKTYMHSGNEALRQLAISLAPTYLVSSKSIKSQFSRDMVDFVRSKDPPGRFLKRSKKRDEFEEIDFMAAREKTSQFLRDAARDLKSSRKDTDKNCTSDTNKIISTTTTQETTHLSSSHSSPIHVSDNDEDQDLEPLPSTGEYLETASDSETKIDPLPISTLTQPVVNEHHNDNNHYSYHECVHPNHNMTLASSDEDLSRQTTTYYHSFTPRPFDNHIVNNNMYHSSWYNPNASHEAYYQNGTVYHEETQTPVHSNSVVHDYSPQNSHSNISDTYNSEEQGNSKRFVFDGAREFSSQKNCETEEMHIDDLFYCHSVSRSIDSLDSFIQPVCF